MDFMRTGGEIKRSQVITVFFSQLRQESSDTLINCVSRNFII